MFIIVAPIYKEEYNNAPLSRLLPERLHSQHESENTSLRPGSPQLLQIPHKNVQRGHMAPQEGH